MLHALLFSAFLGSLLAPWIHRLCGRFSKWLLALLPALLCMYYARLLAALPTGGALLESYDWAPGVGLQSALRADGLSLLFALLITGIGVFVVIYSEDYLLRHKQTGRLYAFLFLFMGAMLGLVLSDNLLLLFVFWELTSVSSFLLIGFDHERQAARRGALQALLVTGAGGLALLAGFVVIGQIAGSFSIGQLVDHAENLRAHRLHAPALLLVLLGAFTKSAQFPFHFWLPAAMQAPAPVSAYLHAATMVKAGVYLLARLSPVFGGTDLWFGAVTSVGAATMLAGAFLAFTKSDLKQILAYSTVSVLGLLVCLIGLGTPLALQAMLVYLIAHALYKGALFLVAGSIDHGTGTRELDRLGRLSRPMPISAAAAALAALSMSGLPPLFGFIGKELSYEAALNAPFSSPLFTVVLTVTASLLFALAWVVGFRPFFGKAGVHRQAAHEAPFSMWLGPLALAGAGVGFGLSPEPAQRVVDQALASLHVGGPTADMGLFHGVNRSLLLSFTSALIGFAAYILHARARSWRWWQGGGIQAVSPARLYERAFAGLENLAARQTRLLQHGYLRYYVLTMVVITLAFVGLAVARGGEAPGFTGGADVLWYEVLLTTLIIAAAIAAVATSSRLTAVAALGGVGIGISLVFALFGAPDLALTQFVVETLTVLLLVLVLYHLPDFSRLTTGAGMVRDILLASAVGGAMTILVLAASSIQYAPSIAAYFVDNSYPLAQGRNVVNVILTDFRVLDTLGEITVLAVAGAGVYALLRLRLGQGDSR
jgi:multicomponent Na+:H+ antiporter subunit A